MKREYRANFIAVVATIAIVLGAIFAYANIVVNNSKAISSPDELTVEEKSDGSELVVEDLPEPDKKEDDESLVLCTTDQSESTCDTDEKDKDDTLPVVGKLSKPVTLYFFHGDGCPHCAEEREWLSTLQLDGLEIVSYEVWNDTDNRALLKNVEQKFSITKTGVPTNVIGDTVIVGFSSSVHTEQKILNAIYYYQDHDYKDRVAEVKEGNLETVAVNDEATTKAKRTLNFLGNEINLESVSLGVAAVLIGFVDGFNPCAMWILIFLISIMLGMKNRKRMFLLGFTFLFASAMVYMIIMFSWINIVADLAASEIFQKIIGVVALVGAAINLKSWWDSRGKADGCKVVNSKRRSKIIESVKKFTKEKSLVLAILGIIALAVSVNVIELACSAGLPVVFSELLTINNISGVASLPFVLLYILFFMIDDIIVFTIAMTATRIAGLSTKYNKYSHLIGGLIMLIIGILLLFYPKALMMGM